MFHTNFDAKNKLWSGSKIAPFYNPQISVGHAVLKAMKLNPKKTAQVKNSLIKSISNRFKIYCKS